MNQAAGNAYPSAAVTEPKPHNLNEALSQAINNYDDIIFNPDFEAANFKTSDIGSPAYDALIADCAYDQAQKDRKANVPEKDIILTELTSATPDFIHTKDYLIKNKDNESVHRTDTYLQAVETASYYNTLIRKAAREWPDLTPKSLTRHLVNVANKSLKDDRLKLAAESYFKEPIKGAKHELAFGQLLAHTGRQFRGANTAEDLNGIDYVIKDSRGREQHVDVKASLAKVHEIRTQRRIGGAAITGRLGHDNEANQAFTRANDGHLVMWSTLMDQDFGDSFRISEELAAKRADHLSQVLSDTEVVY